MRCSSVLPHANLVKDVKYYTVHLNFTVHLTSENFTMTGGATEESSQQVVK